MLLNSDAIRTALLTAMGLGSARMQSSLDIPYLPSLPSSLLP